MNTLSLDPNNGHKTELPIIAIHSQGDLAGHKVTSDVQSFGWRAQRFFKALALTILSLGIALAFSSVRQLWLEVFSGKEIINIKNLPPQGSEQEKAQKNLAQDSQIIESQTVKTKQVADQSLDVFSQNQEKNQQIETQKEDKILDLMKQSSQPHHEKSNALFKEKISKPSFEIKDFSAFKNLTEIDLSFAHFPLSKNLIEHILSHIQNNQETIHTIKFGKIVAPPENSSPFDFQTLSSVLPNSDKNTLNQLEILKIFLQNEKVKEKIQISLNDLYEQILSDLNETESLALWKILSLNEQKSFLESNYVFFSSLYYQYSLKPSTSNFVNLKSNLKNILNSMDTKDILYCIPKILEDEYAASVNDDTSYFFGFFTEDKAKEVILTASEQFDKFDQLYSEISSHFELDWIGTAVNENKFNEKTLLTFCKRTPNILLKNISDEGLDHLVDIIDKLKDEDQKVTYLYSLLNNDSHKYSNQKFYKIFKYFDHETKIAVFEKYKLEGYDYDSHNFGPNFLLAQLGEILSAKGGTDPKEINEMLVKALNKSYQKEEDLDLFGKMIDLWLNYRKESLSQENYSYPEFSHLFDIFSAFAQSEILDKDAFAATFLQMAIVSTPLEICIEEAFHAFWCVKALFGNSYFSNILPYILSEYKLKIALDTLPENLEEDKKKQFMTELFFGKDNLKLPLSTKKIENTLNILKNEETKKLGLSLLEL